MHELKKEFEILNGYYDSIGREKDRLYIAHNFYIRLAIWKASKGNASFIDSYATALRLLLERYIMKPYRIDSLKRQIGMFTKYMILIKNDLKTDKHEIQVTPDVLRQNMDALNRLVQLLKLNQKLKTDLIQTTKLGDILYWLLRTQTYYALKVIDAMSWRASISEFDSLKQILTALKSLPQEFCTKKAEEYYIKSVIYEGYFRLYKYMLFSELNKPEKDETKIKTYVGYCRKYSRDAERYYRKFKKEIGEDPYNSTYLGHQIDVLMAEYFEWIYVKKKIIKAIKKLGDVKSLLMEKSFEEFFDDLKSTRHIQRISQEYHLLYVYLKLLALYSEIITLKEQLPESYDKWVLELFDSIEQGLIELINGFYKYPRTLDTQYESKIFPRTFIGNFSEYLVYLLLDRLNSKGLHLTKCSKKEYLTDLISQLNRALHGKCKVYFRYKLSGNSKDPDIDIALISGEQKLIAISVKNGHLKGNINDIKREFYLAEKFGFESFVVVINYLKNLDIISEIIHLKHQLSTEETKMTIYFVDLKDFVECLIDNIRAQDKEFSLPMPKNTLLSALDY